MLGLPSELNRLRILAEIDKVRQAIQQRREELDKTQVFDQAAVDRAVKRGFLQQYLEPPKSRWQAFVEEKELQMLAAETGVNIELLRRS